MKLVKVCRNGTLVLIFGYSRKSTMDYSVYVVYNEGEQGKACTMTEKELITLVKKNDEEPPKWHEKFLPLGFEVVND